jgi:hypothetical protein
LPKIHNPACEQALEKILAAESTPLPCAPPITHVKEFEILEWVIIKVLFLFLLLML